MRLSHIPPVRLILLYSLIRKYDNIYSNLSPKALGLYYICYLCKCSALTAIQLPDAFFHVPHQLGYKFTAFFQCRLIGCYRSSNLQILIFNLQSLNF